MSGQSSPISAGNSESFPEKITFYRLVKRLADIFIAAFALIILFPIFVLVSFAIKLQDGGPVLYRQFRVGRHGKTFQFYKFRSMRVDADAIKETLYHLSDSDGVAFKMKNDPRRTKVGVFIRKYSIDELPQFFSVLVGHMSVIGPRPHLPHEVKAYTDEQLVRLSVKPGLLCLREIRGRSRLSFQEWLHLDLEYVQNQNLLLDLKIFLLAIPAIISGDGAY